MYNLITVSLSDQNTCCALAVWYICNHTTLQGCCFSGMSAPLCWDRQFSHLLPFSPSKSALRTFELWFSGCDALIFFPTDIHNSHAEHMINFYQINISQDIYQVGSKSSCSWLCFWHREIAVPFKNLLMYHEDICLWKQKVLLHLKIPSWTCWIGVRK